MKTFISRLEKFPLIVLYGMVLGLAGYAIAGAAVILVGYLGAATGTYGTVFRDAFLNLPLGERLFALLQAVVLLAGAIAFLLGRKSALYVFLINLCMVLFAFFIKPPGYWAWNIDHVRGFNGIRYAVLILFAVILINLLKIYPTISLKSIWVVLPSPGRLLHDKRFLFFSVLAVCSLAMIVPFIHLPSFQPILRAADPGVSGGNFPLNLFRIDVGVTLPGLIDQPELVQFSITDIYLDWSDAYQTKFPQVTKACLVDISLVQLPRATDGPVFVIGDFFFDPGSLCLDVRQDFSYPGPLMTYEGEKIQADHVLNAHNVSFYPYDTSTMRITALTIFTLYNQDVVVLNARQVPAISITLSHPNDWTARSSLQMVDHPVNNDRPEDPLYASDYYEIAFRRPLFLQVVSPILILSILIFIAFLATLENTETFFQGAIAIVFGVIGIKELLELPNITVRTLLDFAIMGLYLALAYVFLLRAIRIFFPLRAKAVETLVAPAPSPAQDENTDPRADLTNQ